VNTSKDKEHNESDPIPQRTMWNDTNAAFHDNETNYEEQYYYIIRAVNELGWISNTSRTVGKWTRQFPSGISTFSLPLEPLQIIDTKLCAISMKASYIKYMDATTHNWITYNNGDDSLNNTQLKLGEGYEVKFTNQNNYTFTGMPGAMIIYDDDNGFSGFNPYSDAKNLTASVDPPTGNVILSWDQPMTIDGDDNYIIYRSTTRDGFNKGTAAKIGTSSYGNEIWIDANAATSPGEYYYMIVPINETGVEGSSTYSIGIWIEEYLSEYDTLGIPLKLTSNQTADWYCDTIPDTIGINYYIHSQQRWGWHSTKMSEGAYDPVLKMTEGYQISTLKTTKHIFVGM
jgi:hypothetical protein